MGLIKILEGFEQRYVSPEVYLAVSGDILIYILIISWIITSAVETDFIFHNPLRSRLGYNNVCVAFDTPPAKWVAAVLYPLMAYFMLRYAWCDMQRSAFQWKCGDISRHQYWLSFFTDMGFGCSAMLFSLTFVIPPSENAWLHSMGFMSLIVTRFFCLLANFTEARNVSTISWAWLALSGCSSFGYLLALYVNYSNFDKVGTPLWGPYTNGFFDYFWFFTVYFTMKFLPDAQVLYNGKAIYTRVADRGAVKELISGTLQTPTQTPMNFQRETQTIGEHLHISFLYNIAAFFGGAYARSGLGTATWSTMWFFANSKDHGETCPWAGNSSMALSYEEVTKRLKAREELVKSGVARRGCDLGTARIPPTMFPAMGSIVTGWADPEQDIMLEWFKTHAQAPQHGYQSRLREVLEIKPGKKLYLNTADASNSAIALWALDETARALCGIEWTTVELQEFMSHQRMGLILSIICGPFPSLIGYVGKSYLAKKDEYHQFIMTKIPDVPEGRQRQVVAWAIYDSLAFAGGVSLPLSCPSIIAARMNGLVPYDLQISVSLAPRFVYEVLRNYPPVLNTSVWQGKVQELTCIATAGTDPKVFGKSFLIRPLEFYHKYNCSFNEPGGARFVCPGKSLSLTLLSELAMQFNPLDWKGEGNFQPDAEAHMIFPKRSTSDFFVPSTLVKLKQPRAPFNTFQWIVDSHGSPLSETRTTLREEGKHEVRLSLQE
eukprot:gb/GEZN01002767.1/.p1 GENE.gb/GEZN01002767.1/~~gb/GEZN01002767.1/.p1  ORF type:complete len:763 (+),score=87.55 gb/GEZN01002767.1/:137-2290(+)